MIGWSPSWFFNGSCPTVPLFVGVSGSSDLVAQDSHFTSGSPQTPHVGSFCTSTSGLNRTREFDRAIMLGFFEQCLEPDWSFSDGHSVELSLVALCFKRHGPVLLFLGLTVPVVESDRVSSFNELSEDTYISSTLFAFRPLMVDLDHCEYPCLIPFSLADPCLLSHL